MPEASTVTPSTVVNDAFDADPESSSNSLHSRIRSLIRGKKSSKKDHKLLGEWAATSIAGNDITSSCLYTAGLCAQRGIFLLKLINKTTTKEYLF